MRLFHYTTIDTLAYMMSNRSIRFGRLDTLDDKTESEQFAAFNPLKYIFSCSFTDDPKESIPLWKMYANMETGIRGKTRARDPLHRLRLTLLYENTLTPLNEIKLTPTEKTLQGIFL